MKIYLRTLLKGICWELIGLATAFMIFKEWKTIGLYFIIRIIISYPYHRFWKKVKFNKILKIK